MSQQDKIFNPYPSLDPALNLKSTLGLPVYEGAQNISSFKEVSFICLKHLEEIAS